MQGVGIAQQSSRRPLVFVGEGHGSTAGVTYHASSQEGDLLVMVVASTSDPGAVSGWTRNKNYTFVSGNFMSVYSKIKGTDTATGTIGGGGRIAVLTYRGGSQVPSVGTVGTTAEGDTNPVNAPAITPQDVLSTVLGICVDQGYVAGGPVTPTGFVNRSNGANGAFDTFVDDKQFASISSTGAVAYARGTGVAAAMAMLMEIKP
jgi:hypothetical protein